MSLNYLVLYKSPDPDARVGVPGHIQHGLVVGDPAHSRGGWNLMIIVVLFNPGHSVIRLLLTVTSHEQL